MVWVILSILVALAVLVALYAHEAERELKRSQEDNGGHLDL